MIISVFDRVENIVGKGEIAHYGQFLRFPQCFQKACFSGASKGVIVWEWVKHTNIFYMEECINQIPSCTDSLLPQYYENYYVTHLMHGAASVELV